MTIPTRRTRLRVPLTYRTAGWKLLPVDQAGALLAPLSWAEGPHTTREFLDAFRPTGVQIGILTSEDTLTVFDPERVPLGGAVPAVESLPECCITACTACGGEAVGAPDDPFGDLDECWCSACAEHLDWCSSCGDEFVAKSGDEPEPSVCMNCWDHLFEANP